MKIDWMYVINEAFAVYLAAVAAWILWRAVGRAAWRAVRELIEIFREGTLNGVGGSE